MAADTNRNTNKPTRGISWQKKIAGSPAAGTPHAVPVSTIALAGTPINLQAIDFMQKYFIPLLILPTLLSTLLKAGEHGTRRGLIAGKRAEAAIAENPRKSDRAIAEEIGGSNRSVNRARHSTGTQDPVAKRVGKDGKHGRSRERR
ncbi:hypothetical protein [Bradyrhizobium ottawaense]|uniref:hypothetical protein n=3 Tax=Bradyrhizobium TaxID=374 RepID=UPI001178AAC2|nr:hypothetical protein [Bradyrhizobium ottawaense]